jgi:hypothetical protein
MYFRFFAGFWLGDDFALVPNCPGRIRRTARDGFDELAQAGERCPPRG